MGEAPRPRPGSPLPHDESVPADTRTILFDSQTVGELLLSVAPLSFRHALKSAGVPAVEIGEVLPLGKPLIGVV